MIRDLLYGVKVNDAIKPVMSRKRTVPNLIIGNDYYVSFENNNAYPCTLVKIINEYDRTEVMIEIKARVPRNGYMAGGVRKFSRVQRNTVYANQIGISPEDAVRNQVM